MKPYGLPRNHDAECPDCADVRAYGRKTCFGRLDGRASQTPKHKAASRRLLKRAARRDGRAEIIEGGE